ncbi:hypothetical protein PTW35_25180 (plasmid) [Photobacterium sp. DA100]|uniref:hypothetical protein n=1 Tax=Photobacterium sp. DA100 TaxID=3027472 RepID=UPI002479B50E|nr:hypothetical protein [Photobacterium sp. DA100]WEM44559.1 hypothetical protein PTW35_25180 [Photobacterium sp. DA100]
MKKTLLKLSILSVLILTAFSVAWVKTYNMSSDYFDFAEQQKAEGNYMIALKGMNKLELRRDEAYLGGYQQVIETWENALLGPKPAFYFEAKQLAPQMLPELTNEELLLFIEIYVELDMRYVPEAALELLSRAEQQGEMELALEMQEFLEEAFPRFYKDALNSQSVEVVTRSANKETP